MFVSRIEEVAALYAAGLSGRKIAERLGVSPPTVSYYLRRLGVPPQRQGRYDWDEVQRFYDAGNSVRDCIAHFGFSSATWYEAVQRGAVRARPAGMPLEELLSSRTRNRVHIKQRLIRLGLKEHACEECGITDWLGMPLSLELHHVNGDGKDHRLENLQLLCPNCHSQTDTWGGRNRGRLALVDDD